MLLGVVEENRKREVMDNLSVCAQLVEKIKKELSELEGKPEQLLWLKRKTFRGQSLPILTPVPSKTTVP